MSFTEPFCCVCLNVESVLNQLSDKDDLGLSHYHKLTSSIAEMDFKEMTNQLLKICGECCVTLNTVYNFRQTCLRNKTNLINYITYLQNFKPDSGTNSDRITDIVQYIKVEKQEEGIKQEDEDGGCKFEEILISQSEDKVVSIKEERDSEEDGFDMDCTSDPLNESTQSDITIKREPIKDEYSEENTEESIDNPCEVVKNEIDIKEENISQTSNDKSACEYRICRVCREFFSQKDEFDKHMALHGKLKKCEFCAKTFSKNSHLISHMLIHSGERPYECDICKKTFVRKGNLSTHKRIHLDERPYKCKLCEKTFNQKGHLVDHTRKHAGQTFDCDICHKKFCQNSTLTKHKRIHTGEATYECELCDMKFTEQFMLTRHMIKHSSERPYECEVCNMKFKQKSILTQHMLIHADEKPYSCEICKKTFSRKMLLTHHMKKHADDRPYACGKCDKTFIWKHNLTKHEQQHGEKSLECNFCNKKFFHKYNLKRHLQTHDTNK